MITRMPQSWQRPLQGFLTSHPKLYERILHWSGRGDLETKVCLALIRPGDVVFDIGANRGRLTLLFSDVAGRCGEVHAFEPVPPAFVDLQDRVALERRYDNIILNQAACTSEAGQVIVYVPGNDSGQASIRCHSHGFWRSADTIHHYTARAVRLDDYARGLAARRVEFVKCDVGGAELPVLLGMQGKLRNARPLLLLQTFLPWCVTFDYRFPDLVGHLATMGYDRFFLLDERVTPLHDSPDAKARIGAHQPQAVLCAVSSCHANRLQSLRHLETREGSWAGWWPRISTGSRAPLQERPEALVDSH